MTELQIAVGFVYCTPISDMPKKIHVLNIMQLYCKLHNIYLCSAHLKPRASFSTSRWAILVKSFLLHSINMVMYVNSYGSLVNLFSAMNFLSYWFRTKQLCQIGSITPPLRFNCWETTHLLLAVITVFFSVHYSDSDFHCWWGRGRSCPWWKLPGAGKSCRGSTWMFAKLRTWLQSAIAKAEEVLHTRCLACTNISE